LTSYTSLDVDGYVLLSTGRYADLTVLTVFRESDKYLEIVRIGDDLTRTLLEKPLPADFEVDEEDEQIQIGYRARGSIVRDRLDVMGFTLDATRSVFTRGISARLERLKSWAADGSGSSLWKSDIEILANLTFDGWLSTFADLKNRGATKWSTHPDRLKYTNLVDVVHVDRTGKFMLGNDGAYPFQFPSVDIRFFLRAVIEACGEEAVLRQDLDEVVAAGYYWYEEPIAVNASAMLEEDFPINARVVVLTEGITDRRALESSLALLYPHLSDYFGFMDFEGAAIAGGAGPLVATLKAFAGAGIANRVIALFDNDTAAKAALRGLQRIKLPPSIRVAQYPSLPLAEAYPTIGPAGRAEMNVNGLAASLELYYGEDVLRDAGGELVPVAWTNYEQVVGSYHGEVTNKAALQQRFAGKLAAAMEDPRLLSTLDWSGMRLILGGLIGAFANEPSIIPDD
jgi:hypothetical protein